MWQEDVGPKGEKRKAEGREGGQGAKDERDKVAWYFKGGKSYKLHIVNFIQAPDINLI